jgi:hypothetical protein
MEQEARQWQLKLRAAEAKMTWDRTYSVIEPMRREEFLADHRYPACGLLLFGDSVFRFILINKRVVGARV